jgi:hypothetical protein
MLGYHPRKSFLLKKGVNEEMRRNGVNSVNSKVKGEKEMSIERK